MGMYDEITLGINNLFYLVDSIPKKSKLKKELADRNTFQTKDLVNCLDKFELADNGKMYLVDNGFSYISLFDDKKLESGKKFKKVFYSDFSGIVIFYTNYGKNRKRWRWLEVELEIKKGRFDFKKAKIKIKDD